MKYKLYQITFLDHSMGNREELKCHLVGYLIENRKKSYVISPWVVDDPDYAESNLETFVILKSTIIDCYEIEIH